jgi:hypothetical protein
MALTHSFTLDPIPEQPAEPSKLVVLPCRDTSGVHRFIFHAAVSWGVLIPSDSNGGASCTGQAIIMLATTIFTVIFHSSMDYGGRPSWRSLLVKIKRRVFCQEVEEDRTVGLVKSWVRFECCSEY